MDFCSTHVFRVRKGDNIANFAAGRIIDHRTHHNSLCRDKNKHYLASYVMVYESVCRVTLPLMRKLPSVLTLVS
jgi:hypothetical protein